MTLKLYVVVLCCLVAVNCQSKSHNVTEGELFVYKISPSSLNWSEDEQENEMHFTTRSKDGPDLPAWIFVKYYYHLNNSLYIFGVPPKIRDTDELEIQLSITSFQTYKAKYFKLTLLIRPRADDLKYEMSVRINDNIENMLDLKIPISLMKMFENNFWKESIGKTYLTFLASSEDVGFRLPPNPSDTTGVVLRFGSSVPFSLELLNIQNQTLPFSKHCPPNYKSITVDRLFKHKFSVDWCYFKLVNHNDCPPSKIALTVEKYPFYVETCGFPLHNYSESPLKDNADVLIDKDQLPKSEVFRILVLLVFIPAMLLAFGIVSWLASFMCLHHTQLLPRDGGEHIYREELQHQPALFSF